MKHFKKGYVANEVETEQIVDAGLDWATGQPLWSSMVQVWHHVLETGLYRAVVAVLYNSIYVLCDTITINPAGLVGIALQVRGSVPLFWGQMATPLSPKPEIILQQFDPIYEVPATLLSPVPI